MFVSRTREHVWCSTRALGRAGRLRLSRAGRSHAPGQVSSELADAFAGRVSLPIGAMCRLALRQCRRRTSPPVALTLVFGDVACVFRASADVEMWLRRPRRAPESTSWSHARSRSHSDVAFAAPAARMHLAKSLRSWPMHLLGVHRCRSARRVVSRVRPVAPARTSPPAVLTLVFGDVACVVRPSADVECGCDVHVARSRASRDCTRARGPRSSTLPLPRRLLACTRPRLYGTGQCIWLARIAATRHDASPCAFRPCRRSALAARRADPGLWRCGVRLSTVGRRRIAARCSFRVLESTCGVSLAPSGAPVDFALPRRSLACTWPSLF
jgi:hypothetical protein